MASFCCSGNTAFSQPLGLPGWLLLNSPMCPCCARPARGARAGCSSPPMAGAQPPHSPLVRGPGPGLQLMSCQWGVGCGMVLLPSPLLSLCLPSLNPQIEAYFCFICATGHHSFGVPPRDLLFSVWTYIWVFCSGVPSREVPFAAVAPTPKKCPAQGESTPLPASGCPVSATGPGGMGCRDISFRCLFRAGWQCSQHPAGGWVPVRDLLGQ